MGKDLGSSREAGTQQGSTVLQVVRLYYAGNASCCPHFMYQESLSSSRNILGVIRPPGGTEGCVTFILLIKKSYRCLL